MLRTIAATVVLLVCPMMASAHGMLMSDPKVTGGTVTVEVFYDDNTPGAGATMRVFNPANEVVQEGKSDDKGFWSFPAPPPGDYVIRAKTNDGHAAKADLHIPQPSDPPVEPTPGRTRPDLTGPMRWVGVGAGLAVVTAAFGVWYWLGRRKRSGPPSIE